MLCPEGEQVQNRQPVKEEDVSHKKKVPGEGSVELSSFKHPKTWKKSISNFFRNQLRSTRSNDGDPPSGSKETFEEKDISPEQKWQSLGKIFRRQSLVEYWNKSPNQSQGEGSQNKRHVLKKALPGYFSKKQITQPPLPSQADDEQ